AIVIELHAGLHHQADDSFPRALQASRPEGGTMGRDGRQRRARLRDGELVQILLSTARHRHLRADYIDRRLAAGLTPRILRAGAQKGGAFRHDRIGKSWRVARARHRAVEVNLAVARTHILADHDARARKRFVRRQGLPGVGPEMIAAEQDALARQPARIRQRQHQVAELRRPQPRVAALLIHLVRSGLDQGVTARGARVLERGAQRQGMRRADRMDPGSLAAAVAPHELEQRFHVPSSGSMVSSAAAMNANTMPAILSGWGTRPNSASARSAVMRGAPALVSGETTIAFP